MEIDVSQKQGRVLVTVLRPKDRINMGNAQSLEQAANQAIEQGAKYLLFDLADVPTITSAGLRTILSVAKKLGGASGEQKLSPCLKLLNPTPAVRQVFKIAGFDSLFQTHTDLQQAIASF